MTNEAASKHNTVKRSESNMTFILTQGGKLFSGWTQHDNIIYEVDAYGGVLGTYVLGVNCVKVNRNRVTSVTETYTVE
jgi:hypothetical protein